MSPEQELRLAALMRRAQTGDETAYAELLIALAVLARRFVRGQVGAVPWADDAVQTTLLSVGRARHTFDAERALGPWFYAILRRRVIDMRRQEERITRTELAMDTLPDVAAPQPGPDRAAKVGAGCAFTATTPPCRSLVSAVEVTVQAGSCAAVAPGIFSGPAHMGVICGKPFPQTGVQSA